MRTTSKLSRIGCNLSHWRLRAVSKGRIWNLISLTAIRNMTLIKKNQGTKTFNQHNAGSSIPMTRVRKVQFINLPSPDKTKTISIGD